MTGGVIVLAALVGVSGIAVALAVWRSFMFVPMKRRKAILLEHGVCPACGKILNQIAHVEHANTACQGCGSVWRYDASVPPEPKP